MQRGQTSKLAFLSRKLRYCPVSLCTIWAREGNVDDLNSFENKCSEERISDGQSLPERYNYVG